MVENEKRRYFRIHFKRQVQLDFSTEIHGECQVKDISLGGMFVNGKFPCKVDDTCHVNFVLTSKTTNSTLTARAKAKIVRREDEGIALEFTAMPFESLVILELILLYEPGETPSDAEMKLPTDLPFEIREEESLIPDKDTLLSD